MATPNTIIVTGASRGIGEAICSMLLKQPQCSSLTLYATSRRAEDLHLSTSSSQKVIYHQLDVGDEKSISGLVKTIKEAGQPVDVLINNAGTYLDDNYSVENAHRTIDINYRGSLNVCEAVMPLLRPTTGRIVNVSSTASSLSSYSEELTSRFHSASTLADIESLAREYKSAVTANTIPSSGFPSKRSYGVSKALMNATTRVLAKDHPEFIINACCPGWVNTDMGNQIGAPPKTPEEGARIPVRLAVGSDLGGVTGEYWGNDSVSGRESGKVQPW